MLGILAVLVVAGCGNGGSTQSAGEPGSAPPPPPPPVADTLGGYFAGSVSMPGSVDPVYAEALVTSDGEVRVFVDSPVWAQFSGSVRIPASGAAVGSGVVMGQGCLDARSGRFCAGPTTAVVELTIYTDGMLQGSLRLETVVDGEVVIEPWTLDMVWPTTTYATAPATYDLIAGSYREVLADFAHDGDVVMTVDREGRMFFQSAHSGCTGNGSAVPRGDGRFNVYDVELLIENCDQTYAPLNGQYHGVATRSVGDFDWDDWLVLWLSAPQDGEPRVFLTMWGSRI